MDQSLRIASFNAENFSLLLDRPFTRQELEALTEDDYRAMNTSIYNPNKERHKIAEIGRLVLEGNYDLVGLCEVGGKQSLSAFNKIYLEDRYETYLHEENSKRGIYVGILVKRGRFRWVKAINVPGAFARNLLKLTVGLESGRLEVFVVHLKSQFGQDRGLEHRIREVQRLCELVQPQRCIVMGDFNGILIRGEAQFEYEPFLQLPLRDVLEAVGVPEELRRTHYHFAPEPHFTQLDYIFCTHDIAVLSAGVVEGEIPLNRAQRNFLPSDHLLIQATISLDQQQPLLPSVEPIRETPPRTSLWKRFLAWLRGPWT